MRREQLPSLNHRERKKGRERREGERAMDFAPSPHSSITMTSVESSASTAPTNRAAAAAAAALFGGDDDAVPEAAACVSSMVDRGGSVESHRMFLARRTALEMLRDRGYDVPEADLARTLPEFRAWWAEKPEIERLAFATTLASDPSNKVRIVFCPPEQVKIKTMREIYGQIKGENLSRLILILQGRIMARARESIKEIFTFKVEIFQITELLVNITKHVLKPKHEVLTAEEKVKLLKEYNVEDSQLPRMLETDAVARYYGLSKGTVVKVIYDSELTGNHVTYRCVF